MKKKTKSGLGGSSYYSFFKILADWHGQVNKQFFFLSPKARWYSPFVIHVILNSYEPVWFGLGELVSSIRERNQTDPFEGEKDWRLTGSNEEPAGSGQSVRSFCFLYIPIPNFMSAKNYISLSAGQRKPRRVSASIFANGR